MKRRFCLERVLLCSRLSISDWLEYSAEKRGQRCHGSWKENDGFVQSWNKYCTSKWRKTEQFVLESTETGRCHRIWARITSNNAISLRVLVEFVSFSYEVHLTMNFIQYLVVYVFRRTGEFRLKSRRNELVRHTKCTKWRYPTRKARCNNLCIRHSWRCHATRTCYGQLSYKSEW